MNISILVEKHSIHPNLVSHNEIIQLVDFYSHFLGMMKYTSVTFNIDVHRRRLYRSLRYLKRDGHLSLSTDEIIGIITSNKSINGDLIYYIFESYDFDDDTVEYIVKLLFDNIKHNNFQANEQSMFYCCNRLSDYELSEKLRKLTNKEKNRLILLNQKD